ncbi:ABC transporter permease [Mycobacterium sp. KBS0706]|uniref:ABC transporter permease n=1 Tax=Mycobacterium sp. KBS0706 TaxID=2578109 RepID=UPI00110F9884|nr:ABC transporter permease [Mycobacterium sp. KBS0706]TSD84038.1 ABC transporter permease [Mycobacterium sp. KBS0706]
MVAQILALVMKELLVLLKPPQGLLAVIVIPVFQLLVFGYAATFDVDRVPIAIMNEDQGLQGRELEARFTGSPVFEVAALPAREAEVRALIELGEVILVLRIDQRFSADLKAGNAGAVQIIVDGRLLNTALVAQSYATSVIAEFNQDYIATNGLPRPTALTVARAWFNPNLLSHWYVIPGLLAKLLLIATLASTALAVAQERDFGTLERLLTAPVAPWQILIGKVVPALVIGFVQGGVMAAMAILWFDVPFRGSALLLGVSLATMLLAAIGIGLMISSVARTRAQAVAGMILFLVPAVMLSGFATPIASMPAWVQALTLMDPVRYFVVIARGLFLRGSGWDFVWPQLWPLILIAATTLGISHWKIRRRLD